MTDTVFALATAPGRAAVAVVRVSGPACTDVLEALAGGAPPPRRASLRTLRDAEGETLDRALVLWMPGPASFTGEDQAELQVHGGPATVSAVMAALAALGLRLAEPGEFTRRAFEGGRLELSQAEAVADLVDAETEAQRRQALDQLGGALSRRHAAWREALVEAAAVLEAEIDFPDEDLPEAVGSRAAAPIDRLLAELEGEMADLRGERVREGFRIALIGAPNAGKSSLLNALIGREAAIVTDIAGTTRDVIEVPWLLAGYKVLIADMAGLRPATDAIEAEGVRRATAWAQDADLRLWLVEGADLNGPNWAGFDLVQPYDVCLLTKSDLGLAGWAQTAERTGSTRVSTVTGEGLANLRTTIGRIVTERLAGAEFPAVTRMRHRELMAAAAAHLRRGRAEVGSHPERAAEDVRLAARELERISGVVGAEDVLDRVFASFCIGK